MVGDAVIVAVAGIAGTIIVSILTLLSEPWKKRLEAATMLNTKDHEAAQALESKRREVEELRRALYGEMAFLLTMFAMRLNAVKFASATIDELKRAGIERNEMATLRDEVGIERLREMFRTLNQFPMLWHADAYLHATKDRTAFHQIPEASYIDAFYQYMGTLKEIEFDSVLDMLDARSIMVAIAEQKLERWGFVEKQLCEVVLPQLSYSMLKSYLPSDDFVQEHATLFRACSEFERLD